MTIEEAQQILAEEYERAKTLSYVINPVAYALYSAWKRVDRHADPKKTDLTGKCGSCKWGTPFKYGKSQFGSYVICENPKKVWRREVSKIHQRTTPMCRLYTTKESEDTE